MAISLATIRRSKFKPPITVLHGPPGIGKSTMGAKAPSPVFIPTEDGLVGMSVDAFPLCTQWQQVMDCVIALYQEEHSYNTVVVDSLSALELLIWRQVAKDHQKTSIDDIPYGRGHGYAMEYWQQFMDGIAALRDQKEILPILIAHSEVARFDAPDVDSYERYGLSLHKRAAGLMYERADIIGFATWKTHVLKEDVGFQKKVNRGIGTGERLLHLVERPAYLAKNRYGLPPTLPLSWEEFYASLAKIQNPTTPTQTNPQPQS